MPRDLIVDFVFVPNGVPFPHDWVRRHPDYISLPARFKGTPAQFRRFLGGRAMPGRTEVEGSADAPVLRPSAAASAPRNHPPNVMQPASFVTAVDPLARPFLDVADLGFGLLTENYGPGVRYAMDLPRAQPGMATDAGPTGSGPSTMDTRGRSRLGEASPTPHIQLPDLASEKIARSLREPGDDNLSDEMVLVQAVLQAMRLINPTKNFVGNFAARDNRLVKVNDPSAIDFSGWMTSVSTHTSITNLPREIEIPGHPGFVLKYYWDSTYGASMVVTIGPTLSLAYGLEHAHNAAKDYLGYIVNPSIARRFLAH